MEHKEMFSSQIRLYGKHARYLRKYAKDKQATNGDYFKLINPITDEEEDCYIFSDMLENYMVSAILGIIENRKANVDNSNETTPANIFTDQIIRRRNTLIRIYRHMVLTRYDELSIDERVKKAFSINCDDIDTNNFDAYVRGGLEIINEFFDSCKTKEDLANRISDFITKYTINI